jgi:hypothetical protein
MDLGHFISSQSRKKSKKNELDKLTVNLIAFGNALQNNFLDDAQDIIRDEDKSFSRSSFDEAILFLFMTVFYEDETPFDTIMKIMKERFENIPEMTTHFDEDFLFKTLTNISTRERKEFDKLCLSKASKISCSFITHLIVERADLTNICITELVLKSIVENDMFEAVKRIVEAKLMVSQGIIKQRKKYRNTYDPENLTYDYIEKSEKDQDKDFSENQNLALLGANYLMIERSADTPTKLPIKDVDIVIEMVTQNKKANDIISIISRIQDKGE